MISPNHDSEGSPEPQAFIAVKATDVTKGAAKLIIHMQGGIPVHAVLRKIEKLPGGIEGYDEGHTVFGYYGKEPTVGHVFFMARYNSAGREAFGHITTSAVTDVQPTESGCVFTTLNSVYVLALTDDPLEASGSHEL